MAALIFSYAVVFPVHLLMRAGSLDPEVGALRRDLIGEGSGGMTMTMTMTAGTSHGDGEGDVITRQQSGTHGAGTPTRDGDGGIVTGTFPGDGTTKNNRIAGPAAGSVIGTTAVSTTTTTTESSSSSWRAPAIPRWVTSGGAPSAHIAALTAHGGSMTFAFTVPIWTRVMGQPTADDGPGRDAAAVAAVTASGSGRTSSDGGNLRVDGGDVRGDLQKLRSTVLTQYRRLLQEFRAKYSKEKARIDGGDDKHHNSISSGPAVEEDEGAEVNNMFFEWQQKKDVAMLTVRGTCMDKVTRNAAMDPSGDPNETLEALRRCEDEGIRGHWFELYGSTEYKRISAFIRNSLKSYMSAMGLEGDAASRGTSESTPDGDEVLWTWASVHNEGGRHPLHDHPDTLVAGTFYIHAPPDAGRIVFHDPRRAISDTSSTARVEGTNIAVKPVPGMVVLFPPWVGHEVEPTMSGEERVAISFNLRGKWKYTARSSVFFGHGPPPHGDHDDVGGGGGGGGGGATTQPPPEPFTLVMEEGLI